MKKTILFIIISLVWSIWLVYFLVKWKQNYFATRVSNFQNEIEQLASSSQDWAFSGWVDFQKLEESMFSWLEQVYTWEYDAFSLKELETHYSNALIQWDERQQAEVLETIYKKTKDRWLLYLIVDKYLKIYDYKKAFIYVTKIREFDENLSKLWVKTFFSILFNSLEFNTKNINDIKKLLKLYKDKWLLDANDQLYYHSVIALWKNDFQTFQDDISNIWVDEKYRDYLDQVNNSYQQYKLYRDVAPYYLNWLLAFVMFENWFYNVAQKMAYETLKLNDGYILPNQIIAYSSFIMNRHDESKKYFLKLIEIDPENAFQYKFFLWISHFWNEKYEDSIIFLSQITESDYIIDAYRYLLLWYYYIWDYNNVKVYLDKLYSSNKLNEYDYYSIFDLVFYKPYQQKQPFRLFSENPVLIKKFIINCYKSLPVNSRFVCIYGRWWYYLANWEIDKTLRYLTSLVNYYPRNYIYETLWDIYSKKWDMTNAKKYYVDAMLYSDDQKDKKYIKDKILKTVLKK